MIRLWAFYLLNFELLLAVLIAAERTVEPNMGEVGSVNKTPLHRKTDGTGHRCRATKLATEIMLVFVVLRGLMSRALAMHGRPVRPGHRTDGVTN